MAVVIIVLVTVIVLAKFILPRQRPPEDLQVEVTQELLVRGTYLVDHVLLCNDCHSERDWTIYGGPPKPPLGAGDFLSQPAQIPAVDRPLPRALSQPHRKA